MSLKILKCVRCGSIKDLEAYPFSGSDLVGSKKVARGSYSHKYRISFKELPVCSSCLEKFNRWNKKYSYGLGLIFLSLIIMSIGTVGGVFLRSLLWAIVLVIIGFIVMILAGWLINKNSEDKSKKYVNISWGEVKVKPENEKNWIPLQLWTEKALKERILLGTVKPTGDPKNPFEIEMEEKIGKDIRLSEENDRKTPQSPKRNTNLAVDDIETTTERQKIIMKCPVCGNLILDQKKCVICGHKVMFF